MDINKIIYYFVIGSLLGYKLEIIFKTLSENEPSAGLMSGPYCVLYGIGTAFMSIYLVKYKDNIFMLFLSCAFYLTLMEYITGILLEDVYRTKLWDYTSLTLCIGGKVCLIFTIIWGILGMIYVRYILPILEFVYNSASEIFIRSSILVVFVIIVMDVICTNIKLLKA